MEPELHHGGFRTGRGSAFRDGKRSAAGTICICVCIYIYNIYIYIHILICLVLYIHISSCICRVSDGAPVRLLRRQEQRRRLGMRGLGPSIRMFVIAESTRKDVPLFFFKGCFFCSLIISFMYLFLSRAFERAPADIYIYIYICVYIYIYIW